LAPARVAFLGLVLLNVHSFATSLANAIAKDQAKVKSLWNKLGGNFTELTNTINKGKTKKAILGINGIGLVAETALVTAAPIVVAVVALLKQIGVGSKAIDTVSKTAQDAYQAQTGKSATDVAKGFFETTNADGTTEFDYKKILIPVAAAVGVYLIIKKRKKNK